MSRALFVTAIASAGLLSACESNPGEETWSTRDQSVLGRDKASVPKLKVDEAALEQTLNQETVDSLHASAIELLKQASRADTAMLRANAIEALHPVPEHARPITQRLLGDPNRGVRFVAAMSVGRLGLCDMQALVTPLLDDTSPSVRAAAMYALYECGEAVDLTPLASMALGNDPEAKGNAVMILGELGHESADDLLRAAAHDRIERISTVRARLIELQVAEALVKLGYEEELEIIRAALFVPAEQGELAAMAAQMCGRLKDGRSVGTLLNLAHRRDRKSMPAEVRLAATEALAQIAPSQVPLEVAMKYVAADAFQIRAQAAMTLGAIGRRTTLQVLQGLLNDPHPHVQVAAAGAIVQITGPESEETGNTRWY